MGGQYGGAGKGSSMTMGLMTANMPGRGNQPPSSASGAFGGTGSKTTSNEPNARKRTEFVVLFFWRERMMRRIVSCGTPYSAVTSSNGSWFSITRQRIVGISSIQKEHNSESLGVRPLLCHRERTTRIIKRYHLFHFAPSFIFNGPVKTEKSCY